MTSAKGEVAPTLLLTFAVAVWGCTPRVTAVAAPHADPLTLTTLRAVPAAIALLVALPLLSARLPRDREAWLWTAVSGLLMVTIFLAGFTEAIIHAGPGTAIVLATTSPFWVVLLARVWFGERAPIRAIGGLVVGFVGIVLIVWSQLGGDAGGGERAAGMGLALMAALGWAVGTLIVKQLLGRRPDIDAVGLTTGQYVAGARRCSLSRRSWKAVTALTGARERFGRPPRSSRSSGLRSRRSRTSEHSAA